MKALTVWQPWASLIMIGAKRYEWRGWDYRKRARDQVDRRIVIHAGTRPIRRNEVLDIIARIEADESDLAADLALPLCNRLLEAHKCRGVLELSAGLGTAVLGTPRTVADIFADSLKYDSDRLDHSKWGWPLSDIQRFDEPVPMRGHQGFWNWRD